MYQAVVRRQACHTPGRSAMEFTLSVSKGHLGILHSRKIGASAYENTESSASVTEANNQIMLILVE